MLELRDYQKEAIQSTYDFWSSGKGKNPLLVCPTGSGKSLIISKLCEDVCTFDDYSRVLILTHSKELIQQNHDELKGIWEDAPTGIYSASLNKRNMKERIIFAGIQSFVNNVDKSEPFDLIIIDEAHMVNQKLETRYGKVFNSLLEKNEHTKIIGLTATPFRYFGGFIYGKNKIFCDVSYEIGIKFLIDKGYLVKPITKGTLKQIDTSNITIKSNGEFDDIELARVVNSKELLDAVVDETIEYGVNRKAWLVFASSIEHSDNLKYLFELKGISVSVVTGTTKKQDRDKILLDFKNGLVKCLIGVGVMTTGFNAPICDLVVVARATNSTSLWVQIVGRGLRTYQDKTDCLILDFGQNTMRHGTLDNIQPIIKNQGQKKKTQKELQEDIRAKECQECHLLVDKKDLRCSCGYEFPIKQINHDLKAYDGAMFEDEVKPIFYDVESVFYYRHTSKNGNECLKIVYGCGLSFFAEYVVINSYYGKKQLELIGCQYNNLDDILDNKDLYDTPKQILIKKEGKFMKVIDKVFEGITSNAPKSCEHCSNRIIKKEKIGYKEIEKHFCLVYDVVIENEWLKVEQNPICEHLDYIPF